MWQAGAQGLVGGMEVSDRLEAWLWGQHLGWSWDLREGSGSQRKGLREAGVL